MGSWDRHHAARIKFSSSSAPQPVVPTLDIFLDPSIIPNLPFGELPGHNDLMGRSKITATAVGGTSLPNLPIPLGISHERKNQLSNSINDLPKLPDIQHGQSTRAAFAGVGAGGAGLALMRRPGAPRALGGHGLIRRISSFETLAPGQTLSYSRVGPGKQSHGQHVRTPSDPMAIRRTTWRDKKGSVVPPTQPFSAEDHSGAIECQQQQQQQPQVTSAPKGITNGAEKQSSLISKNSGEAGEDEEVIEYLDPSAQPPTDCIDISGIDIGSDYLMRLYALTPASRLSDFPLPHPSSTHLHPSAILNPLAIILEALVVERTVLQDQLTAQSLSPIQGKSLQLPNTSGQVDWKVLSAYITELSVHLGKVFPLFQLEDRSTQIVQKTVRAYINKQKKVFGQVAEMYMDQYSFVRGWWDESGMRGCAVQVGGWGEMVDIA